jgi:predicted hydrocarbon binding protein
MENRLFLPNRFARLALLALQEVIGTSAMKALFHVANLPNLVLELPPDNMDCQFAFQDFSRLFESLDTIMGTRGARSLSIRAGRSTMKGGLSEFGTVTIPDNLDSSEQDLDSLLLIHLNRLSNFLNSLVDMHTIVCKREGQYGFEFLIRQCPACFERITVAPVCGFFEGLLAQAVEDFSGRESFLVTETQCAASGSPGCLFIIQEPQSDLITYSPQESN